MKEIKIAVVGNPNTGKSSLINAIAKANLRVGNWPGVTVEKRKPGFLIKIIASILSTFLAPIV